jgi:uncharacterized membrane protein YhiD involved in acid resistance
MEKGTFNFKDIIDASMLNLNAGSHLNFTDVFIALFVTFICALIVVWTYKNTYQGVLYQHSFGVTLVLASLVTTSVIMVISGNLILSLGMVGALSIVRFRAAIKDPLDIIFMFWAISIGIANGVAYWKVSFTSTILLMIIMLIMKRTPVLSTPFLLVIKSKDSSDNVLDKIIQESARKVKLKNKTLKNGYAEIIYEVIGIDENKLLSDLDSHGSVDSVTLVSYGNNG